MSKSIWLIMEGGGSGPDSHWDEPVGWRESFEEAYARAEELNALHDGQFWVRETDRDEAVSCCASGPDYHPSRKPLTRGGSR